MRRTRSLKTWYIYLNISAEMFPIPTLLQLYPKHTRMAHTMVVILTGTVYQLNFFLIHSSQFSDDDDSSNTSDSDDSVVMTMSVSATLRHPGYRCRQCPGSDRPTSHPPPPPFTCSPSTNHILCQCCMHAMPDRRMEETDVTIPPQKCTTTFCVCPSSLVHSLESSLHVSGHS